MDFTNAIKRPFSDFKKLLIGFLLAIIPIVNFFVGGYLLECARLTFKKKNNLPEWTKWGDLFIHGLLTVLIALIYLIPVIVLVLIGVIVSGLSLMSSMLLDPKLLITGLLTAGPLLFIAALLYLLFIYIVPSAILTYAKNYKFGDAFDFGTVFKKAFTGTYLLAWLVGALINIVLSVILGFIPVIGSPIAMVIGGIISITLVAEAYR